MDGQYELEQITYSNKRKVLFEIKDILAGTAFPFIVMIVFSSTIIAFASVEDTVLSLIALIGGEIMLIAAFVAFGIANGAAAYRKYVLQEQKRELNSSDERAVYRTGEYALWKAFVIGFLTTLLFVVFQIIDICAPSLSFVEFILKYACAWAWYPLGVCNLTHSYAALNLVWITVPVAAHVVGYIFGKKKEIKAQEKLAEENTKRKGKKKRK